jgi:translocation and assembly module TamA
MHRGARHAGGWNTIAMRYTVLILLTALLAAPIVHAADPQPYSVRIQPTGQAALDAALKASSQLVALRTSAPAGPFALIGRAGSDYERLRTVMEGYGYYDSRLDITIDGRALDDAGLQGALEAMPAGTEAPVQVNVDTGPLFHLGSVTIEGAVSDQARAAFALPGGAPAVASEVLAAGQRLQAAMQEEGHAYATVDAPIAYQNAHDPILDVSFKADAGPVYRIGAISFAGMARTRNAFLQRRVKLHRGQTYSPSGIEHARTDLLALGIFASVTVRLPKQADVSGEQLPVLFEVQERKPHAVTVTATYSSDLGGSGGATWIDRDVFGNGEQLNLSASVLNWGGSDTTGLGYELGAQLSKPDFLRADQTLQLSVNGLQQNLIAYDQTAQIAAATLQRKLSSVWSVSAGATIEHEKIVQQGVDRFYTLVALPLTAKYDSTAPPTPLSDPLHGMRLALTLSPTESLGSPNATFVVIEATGSTYFDLARLDWSSPGRSVIAVRGLFAEAYGAGTFSLPPDQRFYGGGSATIRGYEYQSVGPVFPGTSPPIPKGGTGLVATGVEYRQRFGTSFGAALFVDAGKDSANPEPWEGRTSVGYGTGVRYYTPIGPVRLDIGLPVRRLPGGNALDIYVGLGQAF